ncbi:MAG: TetR/AcrR family transcriptional regulator [Polyangiales bacterium]
MSKGQDTRERIVDHAFHRASVVGLEGLSLGELAAELELSKSGLFAHFRAKEALQRAVIEHAAERFVARVVTPALSAKRGEPRLRALVDRWLAWGLENEAHGCFFVGAATELDDRPGPLRDALAATQRDWFDTLANAARIAQSEGHFRTDREPEQIAFELFALMLGAHHHGRLLRDRSSLDRARKAVDRIFDDARRPASS